MHRKNDLKKDQKKGVTIPLFLWNNVRSNHLPCFGFFGKLFYLHKQTAFMIMNENNSMPYMKSLATCVNRMITEGYSEDFKVVDDNLYSLNKQRYYKPEEVQVVNFFRFEG